MRLPSCSFFWRIKSYFRESLSTSH